MAENHLANESAATLMKMKGQSRAYSYNPIPSRRECSPRIRKRNRLIFTDHEDTSYVVPRTIVKKAPRVASPILRQTQLPPPDKTVAQSVGLKLRNMLKLPKAHRFLCCEWFYSNIDQPLFLRENEFQFLLKTHFGSLKKRELHRAEWCKIRRLLGKPRRCSPQFFAEERRALEIKRNKIRHLQQRKTADLSKFKDLPNEIPLPLVIGMKATARVRSPQDGLFYGSIDAVDTCSCTYRITFDRPGLGSFSIPDYEVLSNDPPEHMPISAFSLKYRPRSLFPQKCCFEADPFAVESPVKVNTGLGSDGEDTLGGFPKILLCNLVHLTKILSYKKRSIFKLRELHERAEYSLSRGIPTTLEFQKAYASVVLEFDKFNEDLSKYTAEVSKHCKEIAPEHGMEFNFEPLVIRTQCLKEAMGYIEKKNDERGSPLVKNQNILNLIANLTSILSQINNLTMKENGSFEFTSLDETMQEIRTNLHPRNASIFQNEVEIHLKHIQSGISQVSNSYIFSEQSA